jgi:pyridinium-3,5-biscarboxylic acid mononucleotide sulfurtransferase
MDANEAIDAVGCLLDPFARAAVAVSGGIDSLTLAALAARRMGARVRMFHSMTASVPTEATARTRTLASELGWYLCVIDAREFTRPEYLANPVNRCFYCKQSLYEEIARHTEATVLSGANIDDLGDYRPGLEAARQAGARHPFVEAGIDKATIRRMARELGLGDLAEIPASPCLSSRVETGIRIEAATLRRIEAAENAVRSFVPATAAVRCRVRAGGVVIEIDEEALEALDGARRTLIAAQVAKAYGREPTFAPYRMGSAFVGKP